MLFRVPILVHKPSFLIRCHTALASVQQSIEKVLRAYCLIYICSALDWILLATVTWRWCGWKFRLTMTENKRFFLSGLVTIENSFFVLFLKVGYSQKNIGIISIAQQIFKLKFSKFVQDIRTLEIFGRFLLTVKEFKTPGFHTIFN